MCLAIVAQYTNCFLLRQLKAINFDIPLHINVICIHTPLDACKSIRTTGQRPLKTKAKKRDGENVFQGNTQQKIAQIHEHQEIFIL